MIDNYKLYCLTNLINNKKYFGITKQKLNLRFRKGTNYKPTTRIRKAIEKYGWEKFKKEIVLENLTKEEAANKEIEYIKKYDTINKGYNVQKGGFNSSNGTVSEETRKKLSLSHKGQHSSPNTEFKKGKISKAHLMIIIPVYCVELNKIYNSIAEAERELNISHHIWDCLKGKRKKCGGYHWKYAKEVN